MVRYGVSEREDDSWPLFCGSAAHWGRSHWEKKRFELGPVCIKCETPINHPSRQVEGGSWMLDTWLGSQK